MVREALVVVREQLGQLMGGDAVVVLEQYIALADNSRLSGQNPLGGRLTSVGFQAGLEFRVNATVLLSNMTRRLRAAVATSVAAMAHSCDVPP